MQCITTFLLETKSLETEEEKTIELRQSSWRAADCLRVVSWSTRPVAHLPGNLILET
jgi:hypothetical protein